MAGPENTHNELSPPTNAYGPMDGQDMALNPQTLNNGRALQCALLFISSARFLGFGFFFGFRWFLGFRAFRV